MLPIVNGQLSNADIVGYSDDDEEAPKKLKPCLDADLIDQIVNISLYKHQQTLPLLCFLKVKIGRGVDEMAKKAFDIIRYMERLISLDILMGQTW